MSEPVSPTPLREEKRELADYLHQRAYVLECCDTTNDNAEARKLRRWIVMLADLQPVQNAPRGDEGEPEHPSAIALRAWQEAFGTTQLTHAKARLEAAEKSAQSSTASAPVLAQVEAALRKNPLIAKFLDQGFWHAHHVDIVIRHDGVDLRYEADWIKDLWYIVRRRGLSATEAVRAEQTLPEEGHGSR